MTLCLLLSFGFNKLVRFLLPEGSCEIDVFFLDFEKCRL